MNEAAESTTIAELKNIIEAALFAADEPLSIDRMQSLFPEEATPTRDQVRAALAELEQDYAQRGIGLRQIEHGFRFQTQSRYSTWLQRLWKEKPPRYSRALLETLAIIAYRQPVTRADIEEVRGVSVSSEIIKTLVNREWIRQVGHRDVPGKPALFATSRGFLEHFDLNSLSDLPPLSELRDVEAIAMELNYNLENETGEHTEAKTKPGHATDKERETANDSDAETWSEDAESDAV